MSIERRAHPRRPVAVAVMIDHESEHNFYAGVTADISEGGVFVASEAPLDVGDEVALNLTLHDGGLQIEATGVVRWTLRRDGAEVGYGVEWTRMAPHVLAAIRQFVAEREPLLFEVG